MEEKSTTNTSNGQQQFNLRWNNHTNNILQVFTEQFATAALVDVTLSCEGQFIRAHKMVLSACSVYFQDIFRIHDVPHPVIIINGMRYIDVKQVIEFMYRGEVKVLEAELDSLLAVAESLQVKGLSTVRNNNEKTEVAQTNEQISEISTEQRTNKKRKLSNEDASFTKSEVSDDESLSSTIKIEPPEIKDIDEEEEKLQVTEQENLTVLDERPLALVAKPIKTSKSGRPIRPKVYPELPMRQPKATNTPVMETTKACKIPRPPNAFMIFANEWRRKLAIEYPKESNKEISVRLGVMWKNLDSDAKENYYSASRRADEEHKLKYPGYYYSPKEARLRKNLKESMHPKQKKNCDAMRFVKLVMKENSDTDRWRNTEQPIDDEDSYIDAESTEDLPINTTTDEPDLEDKIEHFKIEPSIEELKIDI